MADPQQLNLVTEVVDKFSQPLIDLQRQVQVMGNKFAQANKSIKAGAESHSRALTQLRGDVGRLSSQVKSVLTPAFAAFGVSVFSTAGAIAAITKSVGDFAEHARTLAGVAKVSGFAKEIVEGYEDAGRVLGVGADRIDASLAHFARIQDEWHRLGRGPLANFFATQPPEIAEWGLALRSVADPAQAFQKAIAFLQDERIPAVQRAMAAEAWQLPRAFVETNKNVARLVELLKTDRQFKPPEWNKVAEDWLEAKGRLENVWDDLSEHVGHAMAPAFTRIGVNLREFIKAHRVEIEKFATRLAEWIEGINWAQVGKDAVAVAHVIATIFDDLRPIILKINDLVGGADNWARIIELYLGLKFGGSLINLLRPLYAIRLLSPIPAWVAGITGVTGLVGVAAGLAAIYAMLQADKNRMEGKPGSERFGTGPMGEAELIPGAGPPIAEPTEPTFQPDPHPSSGVIQKLNETAEKVQNWIRELFEPPKPSPPPPSETKPGSGSPSFDLFSGDLHRTSFGVVGGGPNPLLAGRPGGSTSEAINIIAAGSRRGVYDGMIDFYQYLKTEKQGGGGGGGGAPGGGDGGVTPANLGPSGPGATRGPGEGPAEPAEPPASVRTYNPPTIPAGAGPMVADRLKAAGVNLPPELEKKIRGGGQVTEEDLRNLPPAELEKANKVVTGAGQSPLYTDAPAAATSGASRVQEAQQRVARIRQQPLDPRLVAALQYGAEQSGTQVRVTSGGQEVAGPHRTGSHRHDLGHAGDFDLLDEHGNVIPRNDPRRLKFLEETAAAGGGGIGTGYMSDPLKIHAGITGSRGRVGEGLGAYAGTADERAAVARGVNRYYANPNMLAQRQAPPTATTVAPAPGGSGWGRPTAGPSQPQAPPAGAATTGGRGTLVFAHGIEARYHGTSPETIRQQALETARDLGYDRLVTVSGAGTPAQEYKAILSALQSNNVTGLIGFSRGANLMRQMLRDPNVPESVKSRIKQALLVGGSEHEDKTTHPGTEIYEKSKFPGVPHMRMMEKVRDAAKETAAQKKAAQPEASSAKPQSSLTSHAKNAGLLPLPSTAKAKVDAALRIDLEGFPRGTRTKFAADGLFTKTSLHRSMTA